MQAIKRTLLNLVGDHLLDSVRVAEVNEVSPNFRFIDFESDLFKKLELRPGEKVQINTGDWNFRTYTPVSVDREHGRLGILAYVNGKGPGSQWAAGVRPGDATHFFGPRRSLDLPDTQEPLVIFGDETAIAVAASIQRRRGGGRVTKMIFEAVMPSEVESIASDMGLTGVEVHLKRPDGRLSEDLIQSLLKTARNPSRILLAGRAESIRQMRERLRSEGVPMSRVMSKAYWAEGKRGLD